MTPETCPSLKLNEHLSPRVELTVLIVVSVVSMVTPSSTVAEMLSFLQRTFGCQSTSQHAEKEQLQEAEHAATHIPEA